MVRLPGQPLRTGAWLSSTVTVKVQVLVLWLESLAQQVTVVTPLLKVAPLVGAENTGTVPSQLSRAVGAGQVTAAEQRFGAV